jgi:zinc transport system permease protein
MALFQFFQYDFLVRALSAGVILAVVAPLIGMFLVVRGYSLMADALAHMSLLGVALALIFKIPIFIGALAVSLISALGMERLRSGGKVYGEAIIALFLSGSLALSIVIIGAVKGLNANLFSYLFGSLTTVKIIDVWILVALAVAVAIFIFFFYGELFLFALNEDLARVSGVKVRQINRIFMILAAVTVAAALQMVGALLIGALMVVPVLAAMQLQRGFRATLFWSVFFSLFSVLTGFILAYLLDLASGGAIVIVAVILFIVLYFVRNFARHLTVWTPE